MASRLVCHGWRPTAQPVPAEPTIRMHFVEREGRTLIWPREAAERRGVPWTFECRRITLGAHSALDAVGLLAAVARALADAGIGCNPVAGYFHDHLFVPADRADEAVRCLHEVFGAGG